jgi:tRNA pseudouridine32 synthase/23S rRNA pseudouridine746 synthase
MDFLLNTADYVAIAKPAGLAVIPGRAETTSVLEELAAELDLPWTGQADPRLRVVHRIDKETSGVVLFAKHIAAQRHVSHQFQNNTVRKQYLALVAGSPPEDSGQIDAPLAVHPSDPKRMACSKHGRPAVTLWEVAGRFGAITLLRIFPKTGKTHQIRVHLKSIGLPLLIDPLYNRCPPGAPTGPGRDRAPPDRPADAARGNADVLRVGRRGNHGHRTVAKGFALRDQHAWEVLEAIAAWGLQIVLMLRKWRTGEPVRFAWYDN